ncbi:unnamed protein product [Urochloa humidicola]
MGRGTTGAAARPCKQAASSCLQVIQTRLNVDGNLDKQIVNPWDHLNCCKFCFRQIIHDTEVASVEQQALEHEAAPKILYTCYAKSFRQKEAK